MERHIGMDVHAASCTLAVISDKGRRLKDFPVETNGQALIEAVRMIPGYKHLVMEEGLQSAWLYETLNPHVDELVVAGIATSRGPKMEGWFPLCCGERERRTIAMRQIRLGTQNSQRIARKSSVAARTEPRAQRLNSRHCPAKTGADARIEGSGAKGEVRLAVRPYGRVLCTG